MPELSALEVFVRVAATGSINVAARELGRTQQAVSARLAAMETQTGVPLLVRTARGTTLTAAGTVVADWATRLLDGAGEFDSALATLRTERRAHLQVASSLTVAEVLLPGWLRDLGTGAEPVRVSLTAVNSGQVAELVRTAAVDLGFVEGPAAPRGCRSRVIAHDELVLVVPAEHPWANRAPRVDAERLARTPLITREPGSGTREALDSALDRALRSDVPSVPPLAEMSTTAAVRAAVIDGDGPAVLSELVVRDDLGRGRLRRIPVTGVDLHRSLRAVWIGGGSPPPAARALVALAARTGDTREHRGR